MNKAKPFIVFGIVALFALIARGTLYTVGEVEQVIITQFGKPVGELLQMPG